MFVRGIACAAAILFSTQAIAAEDNGREPDQNAIVSIDGKRFSVVAGVPSNINIGGKKRRIKVEISPFREFSKVGIKFKYLSQRHFSYDKLSKVVDHWSLDGNNTIIMVQRYRVPVKRKDIVEQFHKQFQAMKAGIKQSATKLKFKNGSLKGDRLDITLGNVRLSQEIYVITGRKETRTFILQDTIQDTGRNSKEYKDTRKVIEKTLSI